MTGDWRRAVGARRRYLVIAVAALAATAILLALVAVLQMRGNDADDAPRAKPSAVASARAPTQEPPKTTEPPTSAPAITATTSGRLIISSLGVNAPVIPISAPKRVLFPPKDPDVLGWWKDGAAPGVSTGSALITGHTVHTGGGALDDLDKMSAGQTMTFEGNTGKLAYRVTSVKTYHKQTLAHDAEKLFSQEVPGRLVVITCEDWNGSVYLSNVVVTAKPV